MRSHPVTVVRADPTPTLVVRAETTWQEFPTLWRPLLDQVWARLRAGGITSGCRNVMLYLDDVPHVEVGVVADHASGIGGNVVGGNVVGGNVVASQLPGGRIATTTHVGSYSGLGQAHEAVVEWITASADCAAGPRWEIYGPHDDDETQVWTRVCHLLASPRREPSPTAG